MSSQVLCDPGQAIDAAAPTSPLGSSLTRHQAPAALSASRAASTGTTSRTARQYSRAGSGRGLATIAGSVPFSVRARSWTRFHAANRNRSASGDGTGRPPEYDQIGRPSTAPISRRRPVPRPNRAERAALPRVFQGMFGFRRTRRGSPMRSTPRSRASARSSVRTHVVHPPWGLSVSSMPIHISPDPLGPVDAAVGRRARPGCRSASGKRQGLPRARYPPAPVPGARRRASARDRSVRTPSAGA